MRDTKLKKIFLKTKRAIRKGEELYVGYGDKYWNSLADKKKTSSPKTESSSSKTEKKTERRSIYKWKKDKQVLVLTTPFCTLWLYFSHFNSGSVERILHHQLHHVQPYRQMQETRLWRKSAIPKGWLVTFFFCAIQFPFQVKNLPPPPKTQQVGYLRYGQRNGATRCVGQTT